MCPLCAEGKGVYNWSQVCCRARFIVSIPIKSLRQAWLEKWAATDAQDVTAEIMTRVVALWILKHG